MGEVDLVVHFNVFKGKSVRQCVFMSVRRGVSLKALRHKPFVFT